MPICSSCKEEFKVLSAFQKCVLCTDYVPPKPKMMKCTECEEEFDHTAPARRKLGGKINQCIDCLEENTVKYAGVVNADGKQAGVEILKFESDEDKEKYLEYWRNISGYNKGKNGSQFNAHSKTDPGVKFKTIVSHIAANHKGRS